jgi:hypothetical protein
MAYITLSGLKTYLEITSDSDDAILTTFIETAQSEVESYTKRVFEAPADTTRHFTPLSNANGGDLLRDGYTLCFDTDLVSITSIVNGDGTTLPSGSYIALPLNQPQKESVKIKNNVQYFWTYGDEPVGSVAITGRWAWSITPPGPVVMATYMLARYFYDRRNDSSSNRDVLSSDGVVIAAAKIPGDIFKLLAPYQRLD